MGLLAGALKASGWSHWDDRWYPGGVTIDTTGGPVKLDADSIIYCGTVLAAVRWLADAYALCPPVVIRKLDGNRRAAAPDHRAQRVLRNPNGRDTGFDFRHLMMMWLATWGKAYARMVPGPEWYAEQLMPIKPSRLKPIDSDASGALIYRYDPPDGGQAQTLYQSEVLHYRGLSIDGIDGAETYKLIQNVVWTALAIEQHVGTWLRKGTRLGGLLVPKGNLGPTERKEMVDAWNAANGGPKHAGQVGVVPFEAEFKAFTASNKDMQLVELSNHTVEAILRFLGVPGVVVGYQGDKASTYASADAFYEKGGIRHCLLPRITAMEQREEKALLLEEEQDSHQIKHNMDALLRANTEARYRSLVQATGRPFMTGNEARTIEDLNPDSDPSMDRVLMPSNMAGTVDDGTGEPEPPPARRQARPVRPDEDGNEALARGWQFAVDAASRVVRREVAALKGSTGKLGLALRYANDPGGWRQAVTQFYEGHASHVAEVLHLDEAQARAYAGAQRDAVLERGLSACETWEQTVPPRLAALAYGE